MKVGSQGSDRISLIASFQTLTPSSSTQGFIRSCSPITDASPRGFPFAIYYSVEKELVRVHAVLDCRRNPSWIRKRLKTDG